MEDKETRELLKLLLSIVKSQQNMIDRIQKQINIIIGAEKPTETPPVDRSAWEYTEEELNNPEG